MSEIKEEREANPAESLIGDMPFGITIEAIEAQVTKMRQELAEINTKLAEEGLHEGLHEFCKTRKVTIENFLAVTADDIFKRLQKVYDFVHSLEEEELTRDDILQKMFKEKPELVEATGKFYGILRSQPWGYRIFQYLSSLKARVKLQ